jgi:hypothetical protein
MLRPSVKLLVVPYPTLVPSFGSVPRAPPFSVQKGLEDSVLMAKGDTIASYPSPDMPGMLPGLLRSMGECLQ